MQAFDTHAVVVRLVDYGEADRVVTLLTRTHGKLSAMARGARRSRRRFGPGLGLFAIGHARVLERRGAELALLDSWQPLGDGSGLATDLARLAHAGYACELARELSAPREADPRVYDLLVEMLGVLADRSRPARAETLRVFEIGLLDAVGFAPVLDRCALCGSAELGDPIRFDVSHGGVVCRHCHGAGPSLPAAARQALVAARALRPASAGALSLTAEVSAACRDALLSAIHHHLGRPLRSIEFIAKVKGA